MSFCPNRQRFGTTIEEMNETMIEHWNEVVRPQDTVYHLGDVGIYKPDEAARTIKRLNGKIHLIAGNHDRKQHLKAYAPYLESIELVGTRIKLNKTQLFLSHYGMNLPWKMFSIHGHIHAREYEEANKINVGVDSPNCQHLPLGAPLSEEALWMLIEERKKEIAYIKELHKQKHSR